MKKLIRSTLSGLAIVVALIMIFNLSACGKKNDT